MMESFEYQGYWWLPDEPEEKVPGTLRFDTDNGASLDLLGSLTDLQGTIAPSFEPEVILGFSTNGKPITLHGCGRTEANMSMPGLVTSSFRANMVFVGEHFEEAKDVGFEEFSVAFLYLEEWAGVSGFELKVPDDHRMHPWAIEHKVPDPVAVSAGEAQISLRFGAKHTLSNPLVREASITQNVRLVVEYPEKRPLDDVLKTVYHLQNFLSLGVGKPVYPLAIWGTTGVDEGPEVQVYYRPLGGSGSTEKVHPVHMLFTLYDLEDFGHALDHWLKKVQILEPVYQLYFGTVYNTQAYLEQQFLSLVQALETYHRRVMVDYNLPDEQHQRRKKEILDAVPEEHRNWLDDKLKYSHEPSLRRRIVEIFDRHSEGADSVVGTRRKARKAFIHKVWLNRNYRTHYDKDLESQAARGEDLYRLNQKLKLLLEVCLMGEIGFEPDKIRELILARR